MGMGGSTGTSYGRSSPARVYVAESLGKIGRATERDVKDLDSQVRYDLYIFPSEGGKLLSQHFGAKLAEIPLHVQGATERRSRVYVVPRTRDLKVRTQKEQRTNKKLKVLDRLAREDDD